MQIVCCNRLLPNHEHTRYCIRYKIPKVINNTPMESVRNINTHSLQGFSRYIKHTITQSYQELFTIQNCYICSRLWNHFTFLQIATFIQQFDIITDKCSVSVVCTLQIALKMGLVGGPLPMYLKLCLHSYFSFIWCIWCIWLTKIMLFLPQVIFSL